MRIPCVACLAGALAILAACSARKATPDEASKFIDDAEQKLLLLNVDANRADWVKSTYGRSAGTQLFDRAALPAMRWAAYADVLVALGADSVIPRGSLKCITPPGRGWLSIDSAFLFDCVRKARVQASGTTLKLPASFRMEVLRDVYGQ